MEPPIKYTPIKEKILVPVPIIPVHFKTPCPNMPFFAVSTVFTITKQVSIYSTIAKALPS